MASGQPPIQISGNGPILGPGGGGNFDMNALAQQMRAMGKGTKHTDSNLPGPWRRFDVTAFKSAYDSSLFAYMADVMQRFEAKNDPERQAAGEAEEMEPADPKPLTEALGMLEALIRPDGSAELRQKLKPFFPERFTDADLPDKPLKRADLVPILEDMFNTNFVPLKFTVLLFVSGSVQHWNPAELREIPEDAPPYHPYLFHMMDKIDPQAYYPALFAMIQLKIFAGNLKIARQRLSKAVELLDVLAVMAVNNIGILEAVARRRQDGDGTDWIEHAADDTLQSALRDMANILGAIMIFVSEDFGPWQKHIEMSRTQDPKPKKPKKVEEGKEAEGKEEKPVETAAAEEGAEEEKEGDKAKKDKNKCVSHYDYMIGEGEFLCKGVRALSSSKHSDLRSQAEVFLMQLRMMSWTPEIWAMMKSGKEGEDLEVFEDMEKAATRWRNGPSPTICDLCGKEAEKGTKWKHCARCKKVYYCSAECQKDSWVEHKRDCAVAEEAPKEDEVKAVEAKADEVEGQDID